MLVEYPQLLSDPGQSPKQMKLSETKLSICVLKHVSPIKKNYKPTHSLSMAFWFAALSHLLLYPTKKAHFSIQQTLFLKKDQTLLGDDDLEKEKYLPQKYIG